MKLICREGNIEMEDDNPEDELMNHYIIFHIKIIERFYKCLQKLYSGYHFKDKCTHRRTRSISSVLCYIDYTDIINSVNDDKDGDIDLYKTLNELKHNIKDDLKEYIRIDLKLEIINELELEIKNEIEREVKKQTETGVINNSKTDDNIMNPSKKTKSTRTCCLCNLKRIKIVFIRLEIYVKSVPQKRSHVHYVRLC